MKKTIYFVLILCLFIACGDNEPPAIQCEDLKQGIINNTDDLVRGVIDNLCSDLKPTNDDVFGHKKNLNTLVQRFEDKCDVIANIFCYACIKTLPVQSEIIITFVQDSMTYSKTIDISTPDDDILFFAGMHN